MSPPNLPETSIALAATPAAAARTRAPRVIVRRSAIHGRGVFAARDLALGERVLEYRGARISPDTAAELYGDNTQYGHTFLFTLNDKFLVDGGVNGNAARWINHSCAPNCEAVIYVNKNYEEEKDKLYLEAIRDIKAGEELSFDYGIRLDVPHTARLKKIWACRCGAAHCSGTLLKPKLRKKA
jgi:uncharacterized protein